MNARCGVTAGQRPETSQAPVLTVSVFVGRKGDVLQDFRPVLLLGAAGRDGARRAPPSAPPALPRFLVAPLLVGTLRLLLLLLAGLCEVVVGLRVPGGAVEGVVAAVVPGLAEHVVRYLQALVAGAGRLQQRQRLAAALRHLSVQGRRLLSSASLRGANTPFAGQVVIQGPGSLPRTGTRWSKRVDAGGRVRLKGTEQRADGGGSVRVGGAAETAERSGAAASADRSRRLLQPMRRCFSSWLGGSPKHGRQHEK